MTEIEDSRPQFKVVFVVLIIACAIIITIVFSLSSSPRSRILPDSASDLIIPAPFSNMSLSVRAIAAIVDKKKARRKERNDKKMIHDDAVGVHGVLSDSINRSMVGTLCTDSTGTIDIK